MDKVLVNTGEDAVTKAINKGHLLKNKRYKAYRNETNKS